MRWIMTLATAGLAEFAAHWLSLGWGFMTLMAGFVFVAVHVTAGITTVASKASATEARLNAHVSATAPAVNFVANGGTVGGSVVVNGDHHIVGTLFGNGGTLPIGDAVQANSTLTVNGTSLFNNIATTNSDFHVFGTLFGGGGVISMGDNAHANAGLSIGGRAIFPSQGTPGGYPIALGTPWENQIINIINDIIGRLSNSGIY